METMKWAALGVCALAAAAIGIFAGWAFGVRDSGGTVYVTVRGSGNPAEDRWAAQICTAVATWERAWVETVAKPTVEPHRRTRVPVATIVARMHRLTNRLRTDIDGVVPPTHQVGRWQRYFAKAVRTNDGRFAKLEPRDFNGFQDAFQHVVQPWSELYGLISSDATLASPRLGVIFAEADACDEADRHSLTGKPWP
jgi:hypothetical protein